MYEHEQLLMLCNVGIGEWKIFATPMIESDSRSARDFASTSQMQGAHGEKMEGYSRFS